MFLSTYENKIDKKGRVSVPASFRSHLSNLGFNGVHFHPSLIIEFIEACSQVRIEKLSESVDTLRPFEENRNFFRTSVFSIGVTAFFNHLTLLTNSE